MSKTTALVHDLKGKSVLFPSRIVDHEALSMKADQQIGIMDSMQMDSDSVSCFHDRIHTV